MNFTNLSTTLPCLSAQEPVVRFPSLMENGELKTSQDYVRHSAYEAVPVHICRSSPPGTKAKIVKSDKNLQVLCQQLNTAISDAANAMSIHLFDQNFSLNFIAVQCIPKKVKGLPIRQEMDHFHCLTVHVFILGEGNFFVGKNKEKAVHIPLSHGDALFMLGSSVDSQDHRPYHFITEIKKDIYVISFRYYCS